MNSSAQAFAEAMACKASFSCKQKKEVSCLFSFNFRFQTSNFTTLIDLTLSIYVVFNFLMIFLKH